MSVHFLKTDESSVVCAVYWLHVSNDTIYFADDPSLAADGDSGRLLRFVGLICVCRHLSPRRMQDRYVTLSRLNLVTMQQQ